MYIYVIDIIFCISWNINIDVGFDSDGLQSAKMKMTMIILLQTCKIKKIGSVAPEIH